MGLAITRSIVDAHGGRVWATVNQEAGATLLHFTLPAKTEAEEGKSEASSNGFHHR